MRNDSNLELITTNFLLFQVKKFLILWIIKLILIFKYIRKDEFKNTIFKSKLIILYKKNMKIIIGKF